MNYHRQKNYDQQKPQQYIYQPQYTGQQENYNQLFSQDKIKNPESNTVPEVKTPEMNDRDFVNDILANEKYLTDGLNVFAREASHKELYDDIKNILIETHDCEREIFNVMFEEGFYSLQPAEKKEIRKARQQFSNYLNSQDPYVHKTHNPT